MDTNLLMSLAEAVEPSDEKPLARSNIGPSAQPLQHTVGTIPITNLSKSLFSDHSRSLGPSRDPNSSLEPPSSFRDIGQGSFIQRHSGLKVKNPLVSSSRLESKLSERSILRLSQLESRHKALGSGASASSWATLAAIGEISPTKISSSGKRYCVWKLTDLEQSCVSLFLFGRAFENLDGEAKPGNVVAVLSPKMRSDGQFSLSIDTSDQIIIVGTACEFGYCRAKRKDGTQCRFPVNIARCPFCPYHVSGEYSRLQSKRLELGGGTLKTAFRDGFQNRMKWNPGDFASIDRSSKLPINQSVSRETLQRVAKKAADLGSATGARYLSTVADPDAIRAAAARNEADHQQRKRIKKDHVAVPLGRSSTVTYHKDVEGPSKTSTSADDGNGKGQRKRSLLKKIDNVLESRSTQAPWDQRKPSKKTEEVDLDCDEGCIEVESVIGQETTCLKEINAQEEPSLHEGALRVRRRALEVLKSSSVDKKGAPTVLPEFLAEPLRNKKDNDLHIRQHDANTRSAVVGHGALRKRAEKPSSSLLLSSGRNFGVEATTTAASGRIVIDSAERSTTASATSRPYRTSIESKGKRNEGGFAAAFGDVIREMEAREASGSIPQGTLYKKAVEEDTDAQLDALLTAFEEKDAMAQKMDSIKSLKVTAWRCTVCETLTSHRPPKCVAQHAGAVHKVHAMKRWWKCGHCKGRIETLGVKYPTGRCPKCNTQGVDFERLSMFRPPWSSKVLEDQENPVASKDCLLPRGPDKI